MGMSGYSLLMPSGYPLPATEVRSEIGNGMSSTWLKLQWFGKRRLYWAKLIKDGDSPRKTGECIGIDVFCAERLMMYDSMCV